MANGLIGVGIDSWGNDRTARADRGDHVQVRLSGSIGAENDYHEIWNLDIVSVNPIAPVEVPAPPIVVAPRFTG